MEEEKKPKMLLDTFADSPVKELGGWFNEFFGGSVEELTTYELLAWLMAMQDTPVTDTGRIQDVDPLVSYITDHPNPPGLIKKLVPLARWGMTRQEMEKACPILTRFSDSDEFSLFVGVIRDFTPMPVEPFDVIVRKHDLELIPLLVLKRDRNYAKCMHSGIKYTIPLTEIKSVDTRIRSLVKSPFICDTYLDIIYRVLNAPCLNGNNIRFTLSAIKTPLPYMDELGVVKNIDINWAKPEPWEPMTEKQVKEVIYGND